MDRTFDKLWRLSIAMDGLRSAREAQAAATREHDGRVRAAQEEVLRAAGYVYLVDRNEWSPPNYLSEDPVTFNQALAMVSESLEFIDNLPTPPEA